MTEFEAATIAYQNATLAYQDATVAYQNATLAYQDAMLAFHYTSLWVTGGIGAVQCLLIGFGLWFMAWSTHHWNRQHADAMATEAKRHEEFMAADAKRHEEVMAALSQRRFH